MKEKREKEREKIFRRRKDGDIWCRKVNKKRK